MLDVVSVLVSVTVLLPVKVLVAVFVSAGVSVLVHDTVSSILDECVPERGDKVRVGAATTTEVL